MTGGSTVDERLVQLHEENPDALVADGFEDAFIGTAAQACHPPLAVYDYNKCLRILIDRDGMDGDEAIEYMEFNVVAAYVGVGTPLFLYP